MKSNGTRRSVVELSGTIGTTGGHRRNAGGPFCRSPRRSQPAGTHSDSQQQLGMEQCQQRPSLLHKTPHRQLLHGHHHPEQRREQLRVVAKPKVMPRFTRFQVLRIIKLATMDKLRESAVTGPDDPTRQRLPTEGGGGGVKGGGGGDAEMGGSSGGGGRGTGGNGCSDEYHHQFYNTGRIGRRNALPDILGTHCTTTTADLSSQLGALSTSECSGKAADGSGVLSSSIAPPDSGKTPTTTGT